LLNLYLFWGKYSKKTGQKTGSNKINDIYNKESELSVDYIFKPHLNQAKGDLEGMINKMTGSGLALKWKRKTEKSQSQGSV